MASSQTILGLSIFSGFLALFFETISSEAMMVPDYGLIAAWPLKIRYRLLSEKPYKVLGAQQAQH